MVQGVFHPRQLTTFPALPPGDIHQVWNATRHKVISLHVYGADLSRIGSSVRRVYRISLAVTTIAD